MQYELDVFTAKKVAYPGRIGGMYRVETFQGIPRSPHEPRDPTDVLPVITDHYQIRTLAVQDPETGLMSNRYIVITDHVINKTWDSMQEERKRAADHMWEVINLVRNATFWDRVRFVFTKRLGCRHSRVI